MAVRRRSTISPACLIECRPLTPMACHNHGERATINDTVIMRRRKPPYRRRLAISTSLDRHRPHRANSFSRLISAFCRAPASQFDLLAERWWSQPRTFGFMLEYGRGRGVNDDAAAVERGPPIVKLILHPRGRFKRQLFAIFIGGA